MMEKLNSKQRRLLRRREERERRKREEQKERDNNIYYMRECDDCKKPQLETKAVFGGEEYWCRACIEFYYTGEC